MNQGLYLLVLVGIVTVASGFYYYFKIIRAMYWRSGDSDTPVEIPPISRYAIGSLQK